jgi:hypothetical protein
MTVKTLRAWRLCRLHLRSRNIINVNPKQLRMVSHYFKSSYYSKILYISDWTSNTPLLIICPTMWTLKISHLYPEPNSRSLCSMYVCRSTDLPLVIVYSLFVVLPSEPWTLTTALGSSREASLINRTRGLSYLRYTNCEGKIKMMG